MAGPHALSEHNDWPSQWTGPEPDRTSRPTWLDPEVVKVSPAEVRAEDQRLSAAKAATPPDWPDRPAAPEWEPHRWLVDAACAEVPDHVSQRLVSAEQPADLTADLASLCESCPVRRQCLADGVRSWGHGVYGGTVLRAGWPAQALPPAVDDDLLNHLTETRGVARRRDLIARYGELAVDEALARFGDRVRELGHGVVMITDSELDDIGERVLAAVRSSAVAVVNYWALRRTAVSDVPSQRYDAAVRRLAALGHLVHSGEGLQRRLRLTAKAPVPAEVEDACEAVLDALADGAGSLSESRLREVVGELLRPAVATLVARRRIRREHTPAGRPAITLAGATRQVDELAAIDDPAERVAVRVLRYLRQHGGSTRRAEVRDWLGSYSADHLPVALDRLAERGVVNVDGFVLTLSEDAEASRVARV